MLFEHRDYVATGSLGDFDACTLDYYRLTDAANAFNRDELRLLCTRQIYTDREDVEENCKAASIERVLAATGGVFPFLEVVLHFQVERFPAEDLDGLIDRFQLRHYGGGRGEDHGLMFSS